MHLLCQIEGESGRELREDRGKPGI